MSLPVQVCSIESLFQSNLLHLFLKARVDSIFISNNSSKGFSFEQSHHYLCTWQYFKRCGGRLNPSTPKAYGSLLLYSQLKPEFSLSPVNNDIRARKQREFWIKLSSTRVFVVGDYYSISRQVDKIINICCSTCWSFSWLIVGCCLHSYRINFVNEFKELPVKSGGSINIHV